MSVSDPVADMLTKIRNASTARLSKVDITHSRMKLGIVEILKNEGYVKAFKKMAHDKQTMVRVFLKYDEKQNPVIHGLRSVSTPGRRVYSGYKQMRTVFNGFGMVVVSTSAGILTGEHARSQKVGGELLCEIW